jgi:hypothetical protein
MNLEEDDLQAGRGTLTPLVGQRIHLNELSKYNLDGWLVSWDPDNFATCRPIPREMPPNAIRCCRWATCKAAFNCAFGTPHAPHLCDSAERCFDVRPYVNGGVMVWAVPVRANDQAETSERSEV